MKHSTMTKNILRFAVLLMAGAMIFTSCGKKDPDKQGGKDKDNTEDVTKASVQIILDGQFTDWDQITPEVARTAGTSGRPTPVIP